MSEAGWAKFGGGIQVDESTFEEKVGGAGFLDVGVHKDVIISSVEPKMSKAGNSYVRVRYANDEDAGIQDNILLVGKPDEAGNPTFHWIYKRFGAAICDDPSLRLKFFGEKLPNNPELFKGLVGLKVTIKVALGKEGYVIKDVSTGGKTLIDVETGEAFEGTEIYEDYTAANEAAKELGLQRCYCEIANVTKPSEEARELNKQVIMSLLDDEKPEAKTVEKPGVRPKPLQKKPAPVSI
jgi:hypothetical protein